MKRMREWSLHILDLAENALAAGATALELCVFYDSKIDSLRLEVRDNGRGMPPSGLSKLFRASYSTRAFSGGGLGLSLLRAESEQAGATVSIESAENRGTRVRCVCTRFHAGRSSLGDLGETVMAILAHDKPPDLTLSLCKDGSGSRLRFEKPVRSKNHTPASLLEFASAVRSKMAEIGGLEPSR